MPGTAEFLLKVILETKAAEEQRKKFQAEWKKQGGTQDLAARKADSLVKRQLVEQTRGQTKINKEKDKQRKLEMGYWKSEEKFRRKKIGEAQTHAKWEDRQRTAANRKQEVNYKRQISAQKALDKSIADRGGFMTGLTGSRGLTMRNAQGQRWSGHGVGQGLRAAGGMLAGGAAAVGGFVLGSMMSGYQKYVQLGMAKAKLAGTSASGATTNAGLAAQGKGAGRLGYSLLDVAEYHGQMARATGQTKSPEMLQAMRATGMEGGQVSGVFDTLRESGADFTPGKGKGAAGRQSTALRTFTKLMAGSVASGLSHEEIPKYLEGIQGNISALTDTVSTVNADAVNQLTATLGKNNPSMRGAAGAHAVARLQSAFMNPGGGEWGKNLMLQAQGFGRPGSSVGYFQAERGRQQGTNDPDNVRKVIEQLQRQEPNGERRSYMGADLLGWTMEKYDEVEKAIRENDPEDIKKAIDDAKPIEEQALKASQGLLGVAQTEAKLFAQGVQHGAEIASTVHAVEDTLEYILNEILKYIRMLYEGWRITNKDSLEAYDKLIDAQGLTETTPARTMAQSKQNDRNAKMALRERGLDTLRAENEKNAWGVTDFIPAGAIGNTFSKIIGKEGPRTLTEAVTNLSEHRWYNKNTAAERAVLFDKSQQAASDAGYKRDVSAATKDYLDKDFQKNKFRPSQADMALVNRLGRGTRDEDAKIQKTLLAKSAAAGDTTPSALYTGANTTTQLNPNGTQKVHITIHHKNSRGGTKGRAHSRDAGAGDTSVLEPPP